VDDHQHHFASANHPRPHAWSDERCISNHLVGRGSFRCRIRRVDRSLPRVARTIHHLCHCDDCLRYFRQISSQTTRGSRRQLNNQLNHSPVWPSTTSRIKSACPLCRAYSSIMCTRIQRRLGDSPLGHFLKANPSRLPLARNFSIC